MVEVWLSPAVLGFCSFLIIFSQFFVLRELKYAKSDLEEQLDEMGNAVRVVAQVLERLPEMVPQFSINQNPLTQILEFFQQQREQREVSYQEARLRDDNGKFRDASKEEEIDS